MTGWDCQAPAPTAVSNSTSLATGKLWIGNASSVAEERTISGDITIDSTGAATANKTSTGVASKLLELTASSVAVTKGLAILGATSGTPTVQAPGTVTTYTLTLPSSGGSANQVLTTNGSGTTSWANAPGVPTVVSKTSNFTVASSENNYVYLITNATTATIPTASSAGSGFRVTFKRMGNSNVNVKGNSSETIDGSNQRSLQSNYQSLALISTGSEWVIIGGGANTSNSGCSPGTQSYSSAGTYTHTISASQATDCIYTITVKGGGGANGYSGQGGKGGAVQFTYKPPAAGSFAIYVGAGGSNSSGGSGKGGNSNSSTYFGGGGAVNSADDGGNGSGSGGGINTGPYTSGGGGGSGYINSGVVNSFNDITSSSGTSVGGNGSILVEWN